MSSEKPECSPGSQYPENCTLTAWQGVVEADESLARQDKVTQAVLFVVAVLCALLLSLMLVTCVCFWMQRRERSRRRRRGAVAGASLQVHDEEAAVEAVPAPKILIELAQEDSSSLGGRF